MAEAQASDAQLLAAWRSGDQDAGAALFERHYASVARFFVNKVGAAAEDLIQKTFLACIEGKDRFRHQASVRTYLFGIAHNQLRLHYRAKDRAAAHVDFTTTSARDLDPTPSQLVAQRQESRLLLEALRQIPLDYQIVLELYYWEQQSMADIAAIVGVPVGTAKSRLRRGRELLRHAIAEMGESQPVVVSTLENLDHWARSLRQQLGRTA